MSEKEKKKPEETPADTVSAPAADEAQAPKQETAQEPVKGKHEKKSAKEETVTVTKAQMAQMESLAQTLGEQQEKYLRLAAEYDNYRKRTAKEKEAIYDDGKIDTIKKFLGVYDNLERGLAQYQEDSAHRQGLEMILKQYLETLRQLGVTEMEAQNQPFDPEKHSAVMHVEDESLGENTVVEVFQKGFLLGDRVLRFAAVKVAN